MKPPNNRLKNPAPLIEDAVQMAKRLADQQEALNRLQEYADAGLEECAENVDAVQKWLNENLRDYWSRSGVDSAVACLGPKSTNVLKWKQPSAATPEPAPQHQSETLGKLQNGERQLPLASTEADLRAASVAQVKDWQKRVREATNQQYNRPRGSFASKL